MRISLRIVDHREYQYILQAYKPNYESDTYIWINFNCQYMNRCEWSLLGVLVRSWCQRRTAHIDPACSMLKVGLGTKSHHFIRYILSTSIVKKFVAMVDTQHDFMDVFQICYFVLSVICDTNWICDLSHSMRMRTYFGPTPQWLHEFWRRRSSAGNLLNWMGLVVSIKPMSLRMVFSGMTTLES